MYKPDRESGPPKKAPPPPPPPPPGSPPGSPPKGGPWGKVDDMMRAMGLKKDSQDEKNMGGKDDDMKYMPPRTPNDCK